MRHGAARCCQLLPFLVRQMNRVGEHVPWTQTSALVKQVHVRTGVGEQFFCAGDFVQCFRDVCLKKCAGVRGLLPGSAQQWFGAGQGKTGREGVTESIVSMMPFSQ